MLYDGGEDLAVQNLIRATFALSNYFLSRFIVGVWSFPSSASGDGRSRSGRRLWSRSFSLGTSFSLWGVAYFVNFIFHCIFGEMAAEFIGWADSPFQLEVGTASLGFSVVGFIAAFRSFDLRLAAILGSSVLLLGGCWPHLPMITAHNFAPGNAGMIFYMDVFLPIFALPCYGSRRASAPR